MDRYTEAKITIAKVIELAYSQNKGLTYSIIAQKGNAKLTIDQNGKAIISGTAGVVVISEGVDATKIGAKIKRANITFSNEDGMNIGYSGTIDYGVAKVSVIGTFNLEALITSCSGLLCKAARALKGRYRAYDEELKRIMVN